MDDLESEPSSGHQEARAVDEEESSRRGEDSTDEEGARSSLEEQSYMRDVYSEQAEPLVVPDREDLLSVDPGLWPATLSDSDRTTLVRKLTIREETIMPKDSKGKPFPEYLKYAKAANGREKVKRLVSS